MNLADVMDACMRAVAPNGPRTSTGRRVARACAATALLGISLCSGVARAQTTIAIGRAIEHESIDVPIDCPADAICMDGWFRYTLRIERTVTGPKPAPRVRAVHMQHTGYVRRYLRELRVFVLRPITDAAERRRFGADYFLDSVAAETGFYCFRTRLPELDVDPDDVVTGADGRVCVDAAVFERDETAVEN